MEGRPPIDVLFEEEGFMLLNRTYLISCLDCRESNCRERERDGVMEIHCPDCGATFGWKNLPRECDRCKRRIYSKNERGQGRCSTCTVAEWSPEKKAAIDKLIGMAFRDPKPGNNETDAAINEAFKHLE
jgi:hypothetical protein